MRRRLTALAVLLLVWTAAALAREKQAVEVPAPVIGIRGLEKSDVATDTSARDYEAIERLEAVKITPEELAKFKQEGKLK